MKKIVSRLLVFFIGIPVIIAFIVAPFFNHSLFHILLGCVAVLGASELYDIFSINQKLISKKIVISSCIFVHIVAAVYSVFNAKATELNIGQEVITFAYIIAILFLLGVEVFKARDFSFSNASIVRSVFIITYSGLLLTFISRMTVWTLDGESVMIPVLCVFVLMIFMCDSIAWLFGVLFGKNNRGIIKASPNKSIMGFLGGFIGSVGAGILSHFIWKDIFPSVSKIVFLGVCIAISSIIGDLTESVFKRSVGIKDSGNIIPGRGGILDSIDSVVMSAPVFYILVSILFGFSF